MIFPWTFWLSILLSSSSCAFISGSIGLVLMFCGSKALLNWSTFWVNLFSSLIGSFLYSGSDSSFPEFSELFDDLPKADTCIDDAPTECFWDKFLQLEVSVIVLFFKESLSLSCSMISGTLFLYFECKLFFWSSFIMSFQVLMVNYFLTDRRSSTLLHLVSLTDICLSQSIIAFCYFWISMNLSTFW